MSAFVTADKLKIKKEKNELWETSFSHVANVDVAIVCPTKGTLHVPIYNTHVWNARNTETSG